MLLRQPVNYFVFFAKRPDHVDNSMGKPYAPLPAKGEGRTKKLQKSFLQFDLLFEQPDHLPAARKVFFRDLFFKRLPFFQL